MGRARTIILRVGLAFACALAAVVLFLAGSILFFAVGRRADFADQRNRVDALARSSNSTPGTSFAEDLGIPDDIPLNRLRMIATHNSYRKKADRLGLFFIGLAQPGESARLDYAHPPLTRQLDAGVRSFELDLRLRNGEFETAHVPLVDARSTVPSFRLALEEIALWSARNPRHVPLIILLELKSDYSFLDPRLRKIGAADLDKLDALIVSVLGRRLITPDEVRSGAQSLEMAVTRHGWPRLAALRGRILVILHEDETYRRPYIQGRPTLEGRAMFTCAPQGSSDAAIAILNDPIADGSRIQKLVASGYLVRTRADGDGVHNAGLLSAAIASGAQIVSTDFPSAYPASDGYHAAFPNNRMLEIGL